MSTQYDLIGLGAGPFHLSLAALAHKIPNLTFKFFDQKPHFQWHPELIFGDAEMQTSWLKDLVSPIDPTSPFSFLNYLVNEGLFYAFMNTGRRIITRREFEAYCQWVSVKLEEHLQFNSPIKEVDFKDGQFMVRTDSQEFKSQHLSIATGMSPRIPEFAKEFLGPQVFHAKSPQLATMDLREKRVLIIGGGQTGIEIFRNALNGKWGRMKSIRLVSKRMNLQPLDESAFTNEYFTPNYVNEFFELDQKLKASIVESQKLASDGNTPKYLESLYYDLYQLKYVQKDPLDFKILPSRRLEGLTQGPSGLMARVQNLYGHFEENLEADIIILSTGFKYSLPRALDPLADKLCFDEENKLITKKKFDIEWKGPSENKIYALNFSRHRHGIAEPQTSLMAWRSATILNDLTQKSFYKTQHEVPSFLQYGKID